jgi:predicted unusual protein kinase regulating ubiquinone biosynthesis (AarF/ABC1/UbiB family)/HEAT repeat protein
MGRDVTTDASRIRLRGRAFRIVWVAVRIFLRYLVHGLLAPFLSKPRREARKTAIHQKNAVLLKNAAISLKGLLIKVGQFISARVDLLPAPYTDTLSQLQDQVPPSPFSEIRTRLIEELGAPPEEVFQSFNPAPIAAASLGQVHEARLREPLGESPGEPLGASSGGPSGERVAVKVQYPHIEAVVACDLRAIGWIVLVLQKIFPHIRFDLLYDEFQRIVHQELNYIAEGHKAERFGKNFSDDDRIIVPRVIWKHTTPRVLTLEYMEGIKIGQMELLRQAGIDPRSVATLLAESYMTQILQHRFFHGDPHPGNLFVRPGPKLVFVDFGLMQEIGATVHGGVKKMILAIIDRDVPNIARALLELGFIERTERLGQIEKVVAFFMERYRDTHPSAFQKITIRQIAEDCAVILRAVPSLQVPNHFILVGRTVGMLNGLCSRLDPNLNIIELARPHAQRWVRRSGGIVALLSTGRKIVRMLIGAPEKLDTLLETVNGRELRTHMISEDLTEILTKIYKLAYRTVLVGIAAAAFLFFLLSAGCSGPPQREITRAQMAYEEGDYPRALALTEVSLQQQPNDPVARRLLILTSLGGGTEAQVQAALSAYEALVKETPGVEPSLLKEISLVTVRRSLRHENMFVKSAAVKALGEMGDPENVALLIPMLKDPEVFVRFFTAEALGQLDDGGEGTLKLLMAAGQDPDPMVRVAAVKALAPAEGGALRSPDLVGRLLTAFEADVEPTVQLFALSGQARLGVPTALPKMLLMSQRLDPSNAPGALAALGHSRQAAALAPLSATVENAEASLRMYAAAALGELGRPEAEAPLSHLLQDTEPSVRASAAAALGKLGQSDAIPSLSKALSDADPSVRVSAAEGLLRLGREADAYPVLEEALKEEDYGIRHAAIGALRKGTQTGPAFGILEKQFKDPAPRVRIAVARALGEMGNAEEALPRLKQALRDSDLAVRTYVAGSIGRLLNQQAGKKLKKVIE